MKVLFYYRAAESHGIEIMSSVLKKAGHKTELIFDPGLDHNPYFKSPLKINENKLLLKAKNFSPDLVAFSCETNLFPYVEKWSGMLKKELDIPIIVGGPHTTALPNFVLKKKSIDMVCRGEGELALLELVNSLEQRRLNNKIKNIWFKKNSKIIRNPLRPLIKDLDKLPFPDKDLFYKYGVFTDRANVISSRDCVFNCSFCINSFYNKLYSKRGIRKRSVDNLILELISYKNKYKIKSIDFLDDMFITNIKWLKEFSIKYKKYINLPFRCHAHPISLNKKNIIILKKAGIDMIFLGIDSADKNILKLMNRNVSLKKVEEIIHILKKKNIKIQTSALFSCPGEDKKKMWKTVKFTEKINPDEVSTYTFYPFPGSELYKKIKKDLTKKQIGIIKNGLYNYKEKSILNNKNNELAYKISSILPLYIKSPKIIKRLLEKSLYFNNSKMLKVLFFVTIPITYKWQGRQRIKETISIIHHSIKDRMIKNILT